MPNNCHNHVMFMPHSSSSVHLDTHTNQHGGSNDKQRIPATSLKPLSLPTGPKALSEAMRHADFCMKQGDTDMAAHWQATIEEVPQFQKPGPLQPDRIQPRGLILVPSSALRAPSPVQSTGEGKNV